MAAIQRTADLTVLDRTLVRVGATGEPPATHPLEAQHHFVRGGPPAAVYRELQGFVRRDRQKHAEAAYSEARAAVRARPAAERRAAVLFTDRNVSDASFANCEGDPHGPTGDPREAPTGRRWMYGSTAPRPGERPISDWTPFRT